MAKTIPEDRNTCTCILIKVGCLKKCRGYKRFSLVTKGCNFSMTMKAIKRTPVTVHSATTVPETNEYMTPPKVRVIVRQVEPERKMTALIQSIRQSLSASVLHG